ncbi:serine hydrolase [Kitasatospora phosalacinea]|uniref:D-alanyl-D-alanine carboxypeptidase n=1 Tax=Kitasatospora phosalacinea TaxID=2065 RepID=A0A9W6PHS5_9ACTN|nr:serine hydrolase [Kitasatospora phosalacinea]GLW55356.1 D-alanyl-D-alanine carboxypeptidase [Kitasatospora phosalacinea]
MGESPKSERPDGEERSTGTEETPHEPGDAAGSGTVHLRVRDADTRTTALRLPADLPESSAALGASRPTPRDEDVPESETEPTGPQPTMTLRLSDLPKGGESEAESEDAPAGPQPTMMLRLSDLPKGGAADEDTEVEDEAEDAPAAKPEPTMMLRLSDLPKGGESEPEAESESEDAPAGPEPTMMLRLSDLPKGGAADEDTEVEDEAEDAPAAKPEPTMTLRVDKERPEQTVMLRLPKEAAPETEPKTEPKVEPKAGPVAKTVPAAAESKAEPKPAPEPAAGPKPAPAPEPRSVPRPAPAAPPAPVAAAAPVAPAPVAPAPGPESTAEALEVLKGLSARPVSPLRRAVKRVTIWGVFLAVVLGVLVAAQLLRPLPTPQAKLSLQDSFTFGGEQPNIPWPTRGQAAAEVVGVGSLGASGEETPVPIASVTKVMNAYLILQAHPLKKGESGPVITVDQQAAQESGNSDESTVVLKEGQQLTEYEALEMLMLPSANNVARLLARWDSGSEAEFLKKMNATAAQLGMTNTTYADPAGYVNDTKSTAKDQLKLAEKVMQMEIFRQIVAEPDTRFNGQRVYNTNALLGKNGNIGVKTGSSTPAQSCLMWAAVKEIGGEERMILGVTLGQPQTKEEMSLVRAAQPPSDRINVAAQAALAGRTLAKQGDVVGHVDDGVGGKVPLVAAKDLTVAGWNGVTAHLTLTPVGKIAHTLAAGTQVGTLSAGEGEGRVEVPVTLQSDLAPASIGSRLLRLG